jgi:hypothetical protein
MALSWFQPKAEPSRTMRVTQPVPLSDKIQPTVDEFTATAAEQILANHAFEKVFQRMRQERLSAIVNSANGVAGLADREEAHMGLKAIDRIEADLRAMADELKLHKRRHKEAA